MQISKNKVEKEYKLAVRQSKTVSGGELWLGYSWALKEILEGLFSEKEDEK